MSRTKNVRLLFCGIEYHKMLNRLKRVWVEVRKIVLHRVLMIPLVLWSVALGKCDADCFNNRGHGLLSIQEVDGVMINDLVHVVSIGW